ncbi:MAG: hypothetical protein Q8P20_07840, partial [bacterium]|nr:hypothetical protein [bacterium]
EKNSLIYLMMVTFEAMAEALYQLRKKNGMYYNPPLEEIVEEAERRNATSWMQRLKILWKKNYY